MPKKLPPHLQKLIDPRTGDFTKRAKSRLGKSGEDRLLRKKSRRDKNKSFIDKTPQGYGPEEVDEAKDPYQVIRDFLAAKKAREERGQELRRQRDAEEEKRRNPKSKELDEEVYKVNFLIGTKDGRRVFSSKLEPKAFHTVMRALRANKQILGVIENTEQVARDIIMNGKAVVNGVHVEIKTRTPKEMR